MRSSRLLRGLVIALFVFAIGVGAASLFDQVEAKGPCVCPQIYAPVECDKGKVYPNQCVADCRRAKNCVPIGVL